MGWVGLGWLRLISELNIRHNPEDTEDTKDTIFTVPLIYEVGNVNIIASLNACLLASVLMSLQSQRISNPEYNQII